MPPSTLRLMFSSASASVVLAVCFASVAIARVTGIPDEIIAESCLENIARSVSVTFLVPKSVMPFAALSVTSHIIHNDKPSFAEPLECAFETGGVYIAFNRLALSINGFVYI